MLKIKLADLEIWYDPAHCLKAVESDGDALRYVPEAAMSEAVCLKAVERNGDALRYVAKAFWGLFKHMISGL